MRCKGKHQFNKWQRGERLTFREAVLAKCYDCSGAQARACRAETGCPLWSVLQEKQHKSDRANIKPNYEVDKDMTKYSEFIKLPVAKRHAVRHNLLQKQNGRCAICGREQSESKQTLHIDHNHAADKIRGVLCSACNSLLGYAGDNIEILRQAICYLETGAHKSTPKNNLR